MFLMKNNKKLFSLIIAFFFFIFVFLLNQNTLTMTSLPEEDVYLVSKVIDGDTIEVIKDNETFKVRYSGIDTPELDSKNKETKCLAEKAKEANENLINNKKVKLEKDINDKDEYGRLLRYVWLDNTLINEYLVENGFARADTFLSGEKHKKRLEEAEIKAKGNEVGLWSKEECLLQ